MEDDLKIFLGENPFFQDCYVNIVESGLRLGDWQSAYVEKEKRLLTEVE